MLVLQQEPADVLTYDAWHESYLKILRAAWKLKYNAETTSGDAALLSFPRAQSMLHTVVQPCPEAQSKALEQRTSGMSALDGLRFRTRRPIASYCRDDEVMLAPHRLSSTTVHSHILIAERFSLRRGERPKKRLHETCPVAGLTAAAVDCDSAVVLEYSLEAAHKTQPNLIYIYVLFFTPS